MSDAMLSWLRSTIEGDKALAERLGGEPISIDAGAMHEDEAEHIQRHDPRDTIARCDAELALLDDFIPIVEELDHIAYSEGLGSLPYGEPQQRLIRMLARGYRHRSGYLAEWTPEATAP